MLSDQETTDYVSALERELVRTHRRSMLPIWVFAGLVSVLCLVAWLHHAYPHGHERFVEELR